MSRIFIFLLFLLFLNICNASDVQPCNKAIANVVGEYFEIDRFWSQFYEPEPGGMNDLGVILGPSEMEAGVIWGNACKVWPYDRNKIIAAFFYEIPEAGSRYSKFGKLIVAVMESNKIIASHKDSGDGWIVENIRVDTARYDLAAGVRAFGIDEREHYHASCGDGGLRWSRKLFVINDNSLDLVADITIDKWKYIKGGNPRCVQSKDSVIKDTFSSIAIGKGSANGYKDLVITEKATFSSEPDKINVSQYVLTFNGTKYVRK